MDKWSGWICDTCGDLIEKPEDGWVEWIEFRNPSGKIKGKNLRLVHHIMASPLKESESGCYFKEWELEETKGSMCDLSLQAFLGPDGLMRLLFYIPDRILPIREIVEMIKRLHVPGYEHARFHCKRVLDELEMEPYPVPGFYSQKQINAVLEYIEENEE